MTTIDNPNDGGLDLVIERVVDAPADLIWQAWTVPEQLMAWWCPLPWKTVECDIDLRPGGAFRTVMRSPDGVDLPANNGCYLEVVPNRRLVWTNALGPGFRPAHKPQPLAMTGILTLEPEGRRTRYRAAALHADEADRQKA